MLSKIKDIVIKVKNENPLILNITNYVTMDFVANGLLSLGASPVMSNAQQEIEELLQLAKAIVINLGTLDEKFVSLCKHACGLANEFKIPIILDPVGAGASHYRTDTSLQLINNYKIDILRGNASEVMSLSGIATATKGVDSMSQSDFAVESAKVLSTQNNAAVIISGKNDFIVDGKNISQVSYGSALMPLITGTGCLLSAIIAAFYAVEKNRFHASACATAFYGICGENAEKQAQRPASFKVKFLDELNSTPNENAYEK